MLGDFNSREDSHLTKFKQKPWIFIKLSFTESCGSKSSVLHPFDKMATIHWVKID